jgi:hypothetical protein
MHDRLETRPDQTRRARWLRGATLVAILGVGLLAGAAIGRSTAPPPVSQNAPRGKNAAGLEQSNRKLMTLRGEIVDYYCFIEKGLRGPGHLECAVKCVAGDVCMGLYTTDGELMMISVNHLRAMAPLSFKGIPNPFDRCRGLLAQTVDLTGYKMERLGQKIIEVMDVKPVGPATEPAKG